MAVNNFMLGTLKLEVAPRKILYIKYKWAEFVFKTLSKKEYDEIITLAAGDKDEFDNLVCEFSYLYPKDYSFRNGIAGCTPYFADAVVKESLVTSVEDIKDEIIKSREKTKTLENQCFIAIKSAMPDISKEKFDSMSWQEISELVALSESILMIKHASLISAIKGEVFDYTIRFEDKAKEDESEIKEAIERERLVKDLYQKGIDPAYHFNIPLVKKQDTIVPKVLTGGRYWNRDDVLNEIRKENRRY